MAIRRKLESWLSWFPWYRRREREADLARELREHLALEAQEQRAAGLSADEAGHAAHRALGNVLRIEEDVRSAWGFQWLETPIRDVRYGLRQLRRSPGFTAVAVLTLALGIGANTAVFSLLDAVLLRPLPYSHPNHLFQLFPTQAGHAMTSTSYPDFEDWKEQSRTFQEMAAYEQDDLNVTGTSSPERLRALFSTPGLFGLLGTHPALGREFGAEDGAHVVLLSYGLWQRRYAADPGIIGKSIYLDASAYAVLGVLPPAFYFPPVEYEGGLTAQVFVPAIPNTGRGWNYLRVIGRLAPGATEHEAQTEMNGIAARLAKAYPNPNRGPRIVLGRLPEVAASGMRRTGWILFGAVGFVLLIACVNMANLLLAQGATRENEIAIRNMVGATRLRITRQLLTENLLLAAFGGLLGIVLADWALPVLASAVPENTMFFTRVHDVGVHLDSAVFAFCALAAVFSAILFGVLPAWHATRPAPTTRVTPRKGGMRGALIALEVALSLVLLAGAGLMLRSLIRLMDVDPGFPTQGLMTMDLNLSGNNYASPQEQAAFFDRVLGRLKSLPAVVSAGAVTNLPLTRNDTWNGFEIPGAHARKGVAGYHAASPDYFRTMGIPLLAGRELSNYDAARSPLVGVISRSMARKYWPHQNPIGTSIVIEPVVATATPKGTSIHTERQQLEVVGIVGDVRQLGLDDTPASELYIPYAQWPSEEMSLVVRTKSRPSSLIPMVEKAIWSADPDQPVTEVRTMDEWVAKEAASRRFLLQLIGAFALTALLLATVGIYGVVSYRTRQRTHEIGIRLALGAQKAEVLRMVLRQGILIVGFGLAAGILAAAAMARLIGNFLYGVSPLDPLTYLGAAALLAAVALLASYIPARRAARVDPAVALRSE